MAATGSGITTRNRRTVWTVATQPYSGAHFATFPEKLVEPCILAGTSAKGCCPECGAPWERVVDRPHVGDNSKTRSTYEDGGTMNRRVHPGPHHAVPSVTTGWRATCDHGKEPVPCIVLDPFAGTATAVRVANRLGRKGVGLDRNGEYLGLAGARTSNVQMDLI